MALARRRLLRDLAEVQREPSELVSALPLENDLFEWHANLRPSSGPLAGIVFHVRIIFPTNYPDSPPNLKFPMREIPSFVHPNLYPFGLCLDILSSFIGSHDQHAGWSPAYSVRTLLLQLQSFLFEFDSAPQDHGGNYSCNQYTKKSIAAVRAEAAAFKCRCGHCRGRAYPPLASPSYAPTPAKVAASSCAPGFQQFAAEATPTSEALAAMQQQCTKSIEWLKEATLLVQKTAEGFAVGRFPQQLLGPAASKHLKVRVLAVASDGFVRVGCCRLKSSPMLISWTCDGKLGLPHRVNLKTQTNLPRAVAGDVMEIVLCEQSVQFRLNDEPLEVCSFRGRLLHELLTAGTDIEDVRLAVELRHATVEVLRCEEMDRVEADLQQFRNKESELIQQKVAEEAAAAEIAELLQLQEQKTRIEAERAAAVLAWERVRQPPQQPALAKKGGTERAVNVRLCRLRAEAADLAKPLHEGAAGGLWANLNPHLLLKAFVSLEFSDVAPLSRTCKVWRRIARCSNLTERLQLQCFYLKTSAEEDILGFGINVQYHDDGNLKALSTELDPLSARAFHRHSLRRGVWGDTFTHFLPLALNGEHCRKAMPELERSLVALACGPSSQQRDFEPWMALAVIPQLMNTFVVALMSTSSKDDKCNVVPRHVSERALLGYCSFHHMLLALCHKHPSIAHVASKKLQAFARGQRDKSQVPDVGQLVVYMTVAEGFRWQEMFSAIVDECHVRGVLWTLRAAPRLGMRGVPDQEILSSTLKQRLTSFRLLMFQAHFLRSIARPNAELPQQGLHRYHRQFGQPTELQKEELAHATRQILQVDTWTQVYRALGLQPPSPDDLAQQLRQAMVRSAKLGYHGASHSKERMGVQGSLQTAFSEAGVPRPANNSTQPPKLVMSARDAETKKIEKKLLEIKQLQERKDGGETLDPLQDEKIKRKGQLEAMLQKLRA